MNDDQAREVQRLVAGFLASPAASGLDVGNPGNFERLVRVVGTTRRWSGVDEDSLRMVTAMCWLGPVGAGIPPRGQRDDLLQILRAHVAPDAERRERVMEFVVAYGCGKWRVVKEGAGDWHHGWEGAFRALARALTPAVRECNTWSAGRVVGFPKRSRESQDSDSALLVMRLIHPVKPLQLDVGEQLGIQCTRNGTVLDVIPRDYEMRIPPGAKAVFEVKPAVGTTVLTWAKGTVDLAVGARMVVLARDEEARITVSGSSGSRQVRLQVADGAAHISGPSTLLTWECSCGNKNCQERHRLDGWGPAKVSLWAFVASAVKGPQAHIHTGSFVQGMYFPLLAQEGFEL